MKIYKYFLLTLFIVLLDQAVKFAVYYFMQQGEMGEIKLVGDVLKLHYTTNEGMAFGLKLPFAYGKFLLTGFRIVAVFVIAYYIKDVIDKKQTHTGLIWCAAAILGGAIGNVIDSTFYGVLFNNAPYSAPTPWLHGSVIDMIYLNIYNGYLPDFIPVWGGQFIQLWPIFNVADASIFISVVIILIFQKRFFAETLKTENHIEEIKTEIHNS